MNKEEKYLITHFPELLHCTIPVNFRLAQVFTTFIGPDGEIIPLLDIKRTTVSSKGYQTNQYFLNGGHYKPISKTITYKK
jgi:hypothetical protein